MKLAFVLLPFFMASAQPTKAPTKAPVKPPTKAPTKAPVKPPTKAPTKAPVKSPTKAPVFCFSGVTTVEIQGKGPVRMDELQIGDNVKISNDERFSKVISFAHRHSDLESNYLQIHAQGLATPLEISAEHMLFVNGKISSASHVKIGDHIGEKFVVSKIETVKRHGLYAPATEAGVLQVNGVLVSSYALVMSYGPYWNYLWSHAILAPLRMACRFNFNICKNETYDSDGFSETLRLPLQIALAVSKTNPAVQIMATLAFAPLMLLALLLETLVIRVPVLGLAMALMGALFWYKKKTSVGGKAKML